MSRNKIRKAITYILTYDVAKQIGAKGKGKSILGDAALLQETQSSEMQIVNLSMYLCQT